MAHRVFVTGGSGFVGTAIIDKLVAEGHSVHALVHSRAPDVRAESVHAHQGDLADPASLRRAMRGCDAAIHLVGIIMEKPSRGITFDRIIHRGTRNVVDAAVAENVRRIVFMSALGARQNATSGYHKAKFAAEQYVRGSGLAWTIFRPSIIHGPQGEFMQMVAAWARRRKPPFLFMPYFGAGLFGRGGAGMLQPVYIDDVARAFVEALDNPKTIGEVYPLGGPDRLTWPQLHRTCAQAIIGKRRMVLPLPVWKAKLLTYLAPQRLLGFNRDQVIMSQEDSTCDLAKFQDHFGWSPQPFEPTLQRYADRL
jgi:uncharacterized protein YbjT (DUF2867 family)